MKNLDRMLLGLGVLIPFWLFFGVLLTALAYPDYSHLDQAMSQLGAQGSPTQGFSAWVNNLPLGVLFVLFAVGVLRRLRGSRLALFSAGLILVHGLASFATGYFPCDQGCAPVQPSFSQQMHNLAGSSEPDHRVHLELLRTVCERWRVPVECRELADVVAREHGNLHRSAGLGAAALVRLLERCDAFRKPARFLDIVLACECDARGRLGHEERDYPQAPRLMAALRAVLAVDTSVVAGAAMAAGLSGPRIGERIHQARVDALQALCDDA